jgi:hypothetical protein
MSLWIKVLKPKTYTALSLALLTALTLNGLAFQTLYGVVDNTLWAFTGGSEHMILSQTGSKLVYSSIVPQTLIGGFEMLDDVKAKGVTVTPTSIDGKPITVRGVQSLTDYSKHLTEGALPGDKGPWALMGEKAVKRLGAQIGDIIPVGSPRTDKLILLKIVALYSRGDLKDWEIVIPLEYGVVISKLSKDSVNFIEVEGIDPLEVERLLSGTFDLSVEHGFTAGELVILDSIGRTVRILEVEGSQSFVTRLPFGYYTIRHQSLYQVAELTGFLLVENKTVALEPVPGEIFRLVVPDKGEKPPLLYVLNRTFIGERTDEAWKFMVEEGSYNLLLDNEVYPVYLVGDLFFDPLKESVDLNKVGLEVLSIDGEFLDDYIVTVFNEEGFAVNSLRGFEAGMELFLPNGTYGIEVSKPPVKVRENIKVPETAELKVIIPLNLKPGTIPIELYEEIEAYTGMERSEATLNLVMGVTTSVVITATFSLFIFSLLATLYVQKGVYMLARDNLKILSTLGAGGVQLFRILLPTLIVNLVLGVMAGTLSYAAYETYSSGLTIMGYGLSAHLILPLIYCLGLSITIWGYSQVKAGGWVEQ